MNEILKKEGKEGKIKVRESNNKRRKIQNEEKIEKITNK